MFLILMYKPILIGKEDSLQFTNFSQSFNILINFLKNMQYKGLTLDKFQEDAVDAIEHKFWGLTSLNFIFSIGL